MGELSLPDSLFDSVVAMVADRRHGQAGTELTLSTSSRGAAQRHHLNAVDVGPLDAPVLIFLHGFPEIHRTWRHQIAHLSGRFRCIAPDQRGYRGSSKPQEVSAYTPDKLAGDVFQLADALGRDKFTVVGHDWGGAIAWIAALMRPDERPG